MLAQPMSTITQTDNKSERIDTSALMPLLILIRIATWRNVLILCMPGKATQHYLPMFSMNLYSAVRENIQSRLMMWTISGTLLLAEDAAFLALLFC